MTRSTSNHLQPARLVRPVRPGGPLPKSDRRTIGGIAALALVGAVLALAVLPVHVSQTTRAEPTVLIGSPAAAPPETAWAQQWSVEVALVSGAPVVVEGLRDGYGVPLRLPTTVDWPVVETGLSGTDPATPLRLDASLRQLSFELRSIDGTPSTVRVSVNGRSTDDVVVVGVDPVPVRVDSGVQVLTETRRFAWRSSQIGAGPEVTAWLGPVPLQVTEGEDGASVVAATAPVRAVVDGIVATVPVVGVGFALVLGFLGFGWALLGRRPEDTEPTMAVAVGAAVPALLLGTINYLVSARVATVAVVAVMAAMIGWRLRRPRSGGDQFDRRVTLADGRALVRRASFVTPMLLAVGFVAVPAALTHHTNLGMLQTDIFDYLGVQETYWSSGIVASDLDWGDGLRSIDSSVRSATIGWTPLSPMEGFTAVRFVTIAVALITVGGAARALGARRPAVALIQLGVLSVASVTSLWVEGYLSREMFIWIAVPTLAVPMTVLGQRHEERGRTWLALGAVFAWPAALVPPFMVSLLVPAIGLVATARSDGFEVARRRGVLFSVGFLGLLLPNSRWVINVEKANEYANSVENIGKTFVVPFHAEAEFPAAALGLTGFHTNPLSWQGPKVLDGFDGPPMSVLGAANSIASSWTAVVLAMVALGLVGVAMWVQADADTRPRVIGLLATSSVVAIAVPILLDTSWESQSFFVLMWIWTMSALVLIPLVIGAAVLRGRSGLLLAAPLVVLMLFNVGSSLFEMTMWFSHPQADGTTYHHYDVAADVLAIQDLLDRGEVAASDFRVDRPISVTSRDDDDRVLFNHLVRELERGGARCLNCVRDPRNGSVANVDGPGGAQAARSLTLGANDCAEGEALYRGVLVALCEHGEPTVDLGPTEASRD